MDPDAELLEPTTPDGSEDGDAGEEAGELDYELSEPDGASPADFATIRYQESFDEGDHESRNDEISMEQPQNDEETEDGEIDDLEDGEVKDDDDDEPHPPPSQFFNRRSSPKQTEPLPPISGISGGSLPPARPPATTGQSPGFGLSPNVRPEDVGICKFYLRGQCTWGSTCKFMHPQGHERVQWRQNEQQPTRGSQWTNNNSNNNSGNNNPRRVSTSGGGGGRPMSLSTPGAAQRRPPLPSQSFPPVSGPPVPLLSSSSSAPSVKESDESAWERGLKQARELMKKANEKREKEPDFEEKRLVLPPSDELEIRKATNVYDDADSDGENDRRGDRGDARRSATNYESSGSRDRGERRSYQSSRHASRDEDAPAVADRGRSGHNYPPPKVYRGTSSRDSNSSRDHYHHERRPAVPDGPQVLYPSQRNYSSSSAGRSGGGRDSGSGRETGSGRSRSRPDGALSSSSSSRGRESSRVGPDRERSSRDAPLRDRDDDRRRSGGDYRGSATDRGGGRPLPYDRPSYDGRGEYRDPWERDRRNSATTTAPPPSSKDRPVGRKRSTSSASTFSSKRSKSSSRSKSRDTYSSSRSSASPETNNRKRKERSAPKVGADSFGRIPKLTKDTAKAVDGVISNAASRQRRSASPMTPPSFDHDPAASRLSPEEDDGDDRQPIKMTIKPKSKMRQYSKTELDSSPSPTRSTGAESISGTDEPAPKKSKTEDKKDKDSRREELLKQLKSVEEAIAKKRTKSVTSD